MGTEVTEATAAATTTLTSCTRRNPYLVCPLVSCQADAGHGLTVWVLICSHEVCSNHLFDHADRRSPLDPREFCFYMRYALASEELLNLLTAQCSLVIAADQQRPS